MPLLNYTTAVPASKSLADIIRILQEAGASAIMLENNSSCEVEAVNFILNASFGRVPYKIPANVGDVILTINGQIRGETEALKNRAIRKRRIPHGLFNNKAQAERIAWRIAKDWLEAQLALIETGMVELPQVFLPYAQNNKGETFYETMKEQKFPGLLLNNIH